MSRYPGVIVGLIIAMIVVAAVLGFYFATITVANSGQASTSTVTQTVVGSNSNSSSPYVLTLAITTNNLYNSTVGDQPAYYVLGPNGPESSANISLPAHQLIKLVIINYDDGPANLTNAQYATVSGTQNNVMTVFNNDIMNSSQGKSGIQVTGVQTVSSLPADNVSHTFTIPQLGLNVPVPPSSVVTAYVTLNQTGTFTWFCFTECGSGPTGQQGAMATPGWMTGAITVG
jgi:heme/copper-type cytochrome/quinol oxidase subunit 2